MACECVDARSVHRRVRAAAARVVMDGLQHPWLHHQHDIRKPGGPGSVCTHEPHVTYGSCVGVWWGEMSPTSRLGCSVQAVSDEMKGSMPKLLSTAYHTSG